MVWVAGIIGLVGIVCVLTASLGAAARASARVDAVADLAALAGAVDGQGAAAAVAAANGARLVGFVAGDRVDVVVDLGTRRGEASARAVAGDDTEGP